MIGSSTVLVVFVVLAGSICFGDAGCSFDLLRFPGQIVDAWSAATPKG